MAEKFPPNLVERLKAAIATFPGTKWYGGYHPGPNVPRVLLVDAADKILTLQSSLAEQEKTISKLREEVKEARNSALETAASVADDVQARETLLAHQTKNTQFEEEYRSAAESVQEIAAAIRSLKSQEKK